MKRGRRELYCYLIADVEDKKECATMMEPNHPSRGRERGEREQLVTDETPSSSHLTPKPLQQQQQRLADLLLRKEGGG